MTTDTTTRTYEGRKAELEAMGLTVKRSRAGAHGQATDESGAIIVLLDLRADGPKRLSPPDAELVITRERWNDPDEDYAWDRAYIDRAGLQAYREQVQRQQQEEAEADTDAAHLQAQQPRTPKILGGEVPDSEYHPQRDVLTVEQAPGGNGIIRVLRESAPGARYYTGHGHIVLTPAECRRAAELLTDIADEAEAEQREEQVLAEAAEAEARPEA